MPTNLPSKLFNWRLIAQFSKPRFQSTLTNYFKWLKPVIEPKVNNAITFENIPAAFNLQSALNTAPLIYRRTPVLNPVFTTVQRRLYSTVTSPVKSEFIEAFAESTAPDASDSVNATQLRKGTLWLECNPTFKPVKGKNYTRLFPLDILVKDPENADIIWEKLCKKMWCDFSLVELKQNCEAYTNSTFLNGDVYYVSREHVKMLKMNHARNPASDADKGLKWEAELKRLNQFFKDGKTLDKAQHKQPSQDSLPKFK